MDIICVTNRKLCKGDFLCRIEEIAREHPRAIVLREKDLDAKEYKALAREVISIGDTYDTDVILHNYVDVASELDHRQIHLPLWRLSDMERSDTKGFEVLGASCHSVEDAKLAESLGCTYIFAGHIFDTDCKKGLPGRGLGFLKSVIDDVDIPVYAIGGIDSENVHEVIKLGAQGVCIMSGLMKCDDVHEYFEGFRV